MDVTQRKQSKSKITKDLKEALKHCIEPENNAFYVKYLPQKRSYVLISITVTWNAVKERSVEAVVDWELEFERARRESLREHISFYVADDEHLQPVPRDWTSRDQCPACFGTDMCDAVDRQVCMSYVYFFLSFFGVWSNFNKLKTPGLWTCRQKCPSAEL